MSEHRYEYPYGEGHTPEMIVRHWCTCGGQNPDALVRDYLAAVSPKRLAEVIKASWKVKATLAELESAARVFRSVKIGGHS